jgi:hypothetical protein
MVYIYAQWEAKMRLFYAPCDVNMGQLFGLCAPCDPQHRIRGAGSASRSVPKCHRPIESEQSGEPSGIKLLFRAWSHQRLARGTARARQIKKGNKYI